MTFYLPDLPWAYAYLRVTITELKMFTVAVQFHSLQPILRFAMPIEWPSWFLYFFLISSQFGIKKLTFAANNIWTAGSGTRLNWYKSFTSWWNSWTWHEWRFSHHNIAWPSTKASRSPSCTDECNHKCSTFLQILRRSSNYAHPGTVTFHEQLWWKTYPIKYSFTLLTLRCFEQGFTFPVADLFLEDILEKTRYKIKSERDNFQGNSRRKRFAVVNNDPLSDVFEVIFRYFSAIFLNSVLMSDQPSSDISNISQWFN